MCSARAYGGPDGLVGHTSLRAWALGAVEDPARADAIWIVLSVVLLVALCGLAMRDRSRDLDDGGMAIPAMFCLWSLLTIYHNGNNLILMLPAFAFLWFRDDRRASPWRWLGILVLQAALAFDVPVRLSAEASVAWVGEDRDRTVRSVCRACDARVGVDHVVALDVLAFALARPRLVSRADADRGSCSAIAAMTAKSTPLAGVRRPVSQTL